MQTKRKSNGICCLNAQAARHSPVRKRYSGRQSRGQGKDSDWPECTCSGRDLVLGTSRLALVGSYRASYGVQILWFFDSLFDLASSWTFLLSDISLASLVCVLYSILALRNIRNACILIGVIAMNYCPGFTIRTGWPLLSAPRHRIWSG